MNWLVETSHDHFEPVTADRYRIESGALVLYNHDSSAGMETVVVFAPGHWVSLSPDA